MNPNVAYKLPSNFFEKTRKTLHFHGNQSLIRVREMGCFVFNPKLIKPIFVIGCSRAGTTLVYKTFSEARDLGSLHRESHDFWSELHPPSEHNWDTHATPESAVCSVDRDFVSKYFFTQSGRRRIVDKNNQNGLSIAYLHGLFPDAHFVYVKRSPGDNIHSLIEGWKKANMFATWSDNLPAKVNIEQGLFQRWCFFLAEGWRDYIDRPIEEVCAFQYRAMNQAILRAKPAIPTKQWHEVHYEDLISNPVKKFETLVNTCDVAFDPNLKKHCSEVLNKPYNTFSEIRVDKWKDSHNREKIERIMPTVESTTNAMGYS